MDPLTITAASGLRARAESLEMLANNLANVATAGYKTDREYYSLYVAAEAAGPGAATLPVIDRQWTDFAQGTLRPTGNPLDLALSGPGFFAVNGPSGRLFTRNGGFRLSPAGVLETQDGYAVRLAGGGVLRTGSGAPLEIAPDGSITQSGALLGKLELVFFRDPAALSKQGGSYFRSQDPGAAEAEARGVEVHQGKLEGSNVAAAEGAVRLVSILRHFEMLQRAMALGAEMNRKAVEEVAKTGG